MINKNRFAVLLLVLILFFPITAAAENITMRAADEIESGAEGYSRTVFSGTEVEEFPLEVVDTVAGDMENDLILIKASGEKIDEIGGIAAGMSGSPVYIEDELIGAISYGWETGAEYALVTPIKQMLNLLSEENGLGPGQDTPEDAQPLGTPLLVDGLEGRALEKFREEIDFLQFQDYKVISGSRSDGQSGANYEAVPGSAVAVQLVKGDINVSALGTLTHLQKDRILALGHPFTNRGVVNLMLSGAKINQIIPGNGSIPFKLGAPLPDLLGVVQEDRRAGLAGKINNFPHIIPLRLDIKDMSRGIDQQMKMNLINDQDYLTSLGTSVLLQGMDNTIDRIGAGTSRVEIEILGTGLPNNRIRKENVYFSQNDIAAASLYDAAELLNLISFNPFSRVRIFDIKVDIDIYREKRNAILQRAEVLNREIYPGDTLDIEIDFLPYRREQISKNIELQLPKNIEPGSMILMIDGGYTIPYGDFYNIPDDNGEENDYEVFREGYRNLSEMLNDFLELPRNDEIIVQLAPRYGSMPLDHRDENEEEPEVFDFFEDDIIEIIETDFVMEGSLQLDIEILSPDEDENQKTDDIEEPQNFEENFEKGANDQENKQNNQETGE